MFAQTGDLCHLPGPLVQNALFGLTLIALFQAGCTSSASRAAAGARASAAEVLIAALPVVQKDVPVEVDVIGNVEAYSTVSIKAQINGPVQKVHFREGDFVRKGDLLFTIDPSPFEASVNESEANLARNEAILAQSQAGLRRDIAQAEYSKAQAGRYAKLFQDGILSRDQTEQVQAGADALSAGVRADEAAIKSAQAAVLASRATLANAKIQLGYTTIRAPIDGRTGTAAIKEGNLVTANQTELVTINQVQPTYVTFSVPEANLPDIKKYMAESRLPVFVKPQDAGAEQETGILTFVDNNVDTQTGTIKLKGTFPNPKRSLWPGEFVRVTLRLATRRSAAVVPNQAVQTGQDGNFVYVVKQDNSVESRRVTTGPRVNQEMVVETGLAPGELVVTEGHLRLAPGMRVRLRDNKENAPAPRARS